MINPPVSTVIDENLAIEGEIRNARMLEVRGLIKGGVTAELLHIHAGGRVFGRIRANTIEVHGHLEGDVQAKTLISIGRTGVVSGHIRYGQLALAEGGDLDAHVRNVPPEIGGDFEIVVRRGRSVRVTTADLTAYDPDDTTQNLLYAVSKSMNGHVAKADEPFSPITQFSQADLERGGVIFFHDGATDPTAGFDVVVSDQAGATSGASRTVTAAVI